MLLVGVWATRWPVPPILSTDGGVWWSSSRGSTYDANSCAVSWRQTGVNGLQVKSWSTVCLTFRRRLLTLPDVLQGCCRFAARTWSRLLPPCFFRFFVREHDWEVAVASGERDGRMSSCELHGSGDGDLRLRFLKRSLLAWDSTARGEGRIVVRVAVLVSIGVFRVETPLCRTVR